MVGVSIVKLDITTRWERRWGAGATERCYNDKRMMMGGR